MLPPAIAGGALTLLFASQMAAAALHQNHHHHHSHQLSNNSSNIILGHHFPPAAPPDHPNPNSVIFGKYSSGPAFTPIPEYFQEQIATSTQYSAPPPFNGEHPFILFARSIYSWLVPSMVVILLTAVLGNGFIVLSAMRLSSEASHYNWLCISLAGADAWAASLLIAGLILNSYLPVVLKIVWWQGKCVAALLEIFRIAGMLTSNLHILALAAIQFIGICYPLLYKTTISTERVRLLILFLWIIPIGFVGTWFVSIPGDSLFSEGCPHQFYTSLPFRLYIFVAFASILFLTFIIYALILIYLLRQKARYRLRRNSVLYSYRRRVQSKMKLLTTTLLILSTFTLSWGVCVLYFVLVCKNGCPFIYLESISFQNGLILNSSVNFLVALKLVLNPLIYALRIVHIRKLVADMFGSTILRSRSLNSFQLFALRRPMSRQLSSPRPFINRIGDDRIPSPTISDPPSRGGMMREIVDQPGECDGSGSSRELLRREKCSGSQIGVGGKKKIMRNKKWRGGKMEERKGNKLAELLVNCMNKNNNSVDDEDGDGNDGRTSSALALTIPSLEGRGRMEF